MERTHSGRYNDNSGHPAQALMTELELCAVRAVLKRNSLNNFQLERPNFRVSVEGVVIGFQWSVRCGQ